MNNASISLVSTPLESNTRQQQYYTPNDESYVNHHNVDNHENNVLPPAYDEVCDMPSTPQSSVPYITTTAASHTRQRTVSAPNIVNGEHYSTAGSQIQYERYQEPQNVNEYYNSTSLASKFNQQINICDRTRTHNDNDNTLSLSLSKSISTLSTPTSRKEIKQTRKDYEKHAKILKKLEKWHKKEEKLHRRGEKKMEKGDKDGEKILRKEEKMRDKIVKLEAKVDKEFERRRL